MTPSSVRERMPSFWWMRAMTLSTLHGLRNSALAICRFVMRLAVRRATLALGLAQLSGSRAQANLCQLDPGVLHTEPAEDLRRPFVRLG